MRENIFNEKVYLKEDPGAMRWIKENRDEFLKRYLKEKEVFSNALKNYDSFISLVAKFIKDLGYTSSLEISLVLEYLIRNGYLSYNMEFTDGVPNQEFEINSRFGTSILKGKGCCRNYSFMHYDIMQQLNKFIKLFYCYEKDSIFAQPKNAQANHVISLISYEDNVYGIDLYNGSRLFHFHKPYVLKEVSSKTGYELRYKPYYEMVMGESSIEDIKKTVSIFEEYCKKGFINPMEYEDEIKYGIKRDLMERQDELVGFHESTKQLKKEIVDEINDKTFTHI